MTQRYIDYVSNYNYCNLIYSFNNYSQILITNLLLIIYKAKFN